MKLLKSGTRFIVSSTNKIHCLDSQFSTKSCKIQKDYPIMSLKEANELLLNDPTVTLCGHCTEGDMIEVE